MTFIYVCLALLTFALAFANWRLHVALASLEVEAESVAARLHVLDGCARNPRVEGSPIMRSGIKLVDKYRASR